MASYDLAIDYQKDPLPPLNPADAAWVQAWLVQQGVRETG